MQKFDDEPSMEFNNINTAYNSIRNEFNRDLLIKWEEGKTGIPIIDACMRCLNETGYLNLKHGPFFFFPSFPSLLFLSLQSLPLLEASNLLPLVVKYSLSSLS